MSDEFPEDHEQHEAGAWAVSNFVTPPVCAIAALTLAIVALLDQNAVTVGFAAVLEDQVSGTGFFAVRGLATVAQVVVVLLLARRSFGAASSLVVTLGRAAVLISGIALVPAMLAIVGGAY